MPRKPDISCAQCERPMWSNNGRSRQGVATCHPCRRASPEYIKRQQIKDQAAAWRPEDRECPVCLAFFTQDNRGQVYCSAICRSRRSSWGKATKAATAEERGYGKAHVAERVRWKPLVEGGLVDCCLCGDWIEPGSKWHLDHTEDRAGYRGAAHAACNIRDGASRAARRSNAHRRIEKSCPTCGCEFITPYPRQRFCSVKCRPKSTAQRVGGHCRILFVHCSWCDLLFAARPGVKYCTKACGYQGNLRDMRASYVPHPDVAPLVCRECAETVQGSTQGPGGHQRFYR